MPTWLAVAGGHQPCTSVVVTHCTHQSRLLMWRWCLSARRICTVVPLDMTQLLVEFKTDNLADHAGSIDNPTQVVAKKTSNILLSQRSCFDKLLHLRCLPNLATFSFFRCSCARSPTLPLPPPSLQTQYNTLSSCRYLVRRPPTRHVCELSHISQPNRDINPKIIRPFISPTLFFHFTSY